MAAPSSSTSLDELQTRETRKVLDVIDKLRSLHLDSIVQLPQLVVCGDQSSGKSSVLEALTEVPFPRKETLCTRFATEIVLRRAEKDKIRARIRSDEEADPSLRRKLGNFDKQIKDLSGLSRVIEEAKELMGLPSIALGGSNLQQHSRQVNGLKAFSKHVLCIEIHGPDRPALTVVDLPGYVHSATSKHTADDVKFIQQMTRQYAQEQRTIILAVVSAQTDIANQVVLKEVTEADPDRTRTTGIITKMDQLDDDNENLHECTSLARNEDPENRFELGWHVLKNKSPTDNQNNVTFAERNQREEEYFHRDIFNGIATKDKGIHHLRSRLAELLSVLVKKELPNVRAEIASRLRQDQSSLQRLGEEVKDAHAQRDKLMLMSQEYEKIVQAGFHANWDSDRFFTITTYADTKYANLNSKRPDERHLRSLVRYYEEQFSVQMRIHGHKFSFPQLSNAIITSRPPKSDRFQLEEHYRKPAAEMQKTWHYERIAIQWAVKLMAHTRGRELPGQSDSGVVTRLFQELAENWEELATKHIEHIDDVVSAFVETVVGHISGNRVSQALQDLINDALDARLQKTKDELEKIMKVVMQPVATHDPHFVSKVEALRERRAQIMGRGCYDAIDLTGDQYHVAAENALDALLTIYAEMVEYFITSVLRQVIEQNLLEGLAKETLCPISVSKMSEEQIATIMAEDSEVARERSRLRANIKKFEEAQKELATIGGPLKRSLEALSSPGGNGRLSKRAARRSQF